MPARGAESRQEAWDRLLHLDDDSARLAMLLDRHAVLDGMVAAVPESAGTDVAFVGVPDGDDRIVLLHKARAATSALDRLVVPAGWGLAGRVMDSRRPHWVRDYLTADSIAHVERIDSSVAAEGVRAILAVPILHQGRVLGVLYAGQRRVTAFDGRAVDAVLEAAGRAATAVTIAERARHHAEVAVQEERRRLALELHDSVGAMLFAIGAGVRGLGGEPALDAGVRSRLAAIERQAGEAAATLRLSLEALSAPPQDLALAVALRCDCRGFEERTGLPARVILLSEVPPVRNGAARALADSVREALLNVEKHAGARSVVVTVSQHRDGVLVVVADDGVGMPAEGVEGSGLGLPAMRDRLARLGGGAVVDDNDDGGTTLRLWVPC
ncbi:MAG TPA: GAF domain-containing protein [Candidatus Dormibacteraeota bacterium]|nr:GAF domain-containing protein [Candidatus Dormibacteraeota bacterium]